MTALSPNLTPQTPPAPSAAIAHRLRAGRRLRSLRGLLGSIAITLLVLAALGASVLLGETAYTPAEVWRVVLGQDVPGASFVVGELRLPRALMGLLSGFALGVAGAVFQRLLRNPLASPDIIGVSNGATVAAVAAIVLFGAGAATVSLVALAGALSTALLIYLLANRRGFHGARFILIGIGVAALLQSVTLLLLSRAAEWDIQAAMRWMSGSLNAASWELLAPLTAAVVSATPAILVLSRALSLLELGDAYATSLGLRVGHARAALIVVAVLLLAFATAACGPIAFVAFMAPPIAVRIVGSGARPLLPAGLVGAALVLTADLVGQHLLEHRVPAGLVTGALGAPYLILLLIRINRQGGAA